jgi:hypothetical protein
MANYILLERIELNANTASVTFANIPQTGYTDLKLVMSSRASVTDSSDPYDLIFTLNSTSTIASRVLRGDGTTVASNSITDRILRGGPVPSNYTSNTFSNGEIYIYNYTGSQYKSWSADNVLENNATGTGMSMVAGLTSITAAITSITLAPNAGSFVQYSTFSLYGVADVNTTPTVAPKATGGNVITTDGTYWYHAFLSSGTFTPQVGLTADCLVIAGGGGGAGQNGGAGGAGGLRLLSSQSFTSSTNYTCTIGAGAAATTPGSNIGLQGTNSSLSGSGFTTINATGGGYGSTGTSGAGGSGGSGGGGGAQAANNSTAGQPGGAGNAGSYSPVEGYAGGQGWGVYSGGGGGGAAAVGASASSSKGGNGGVGATSATLNAFGAATTTGELSSGNYYYAGGGGGATGYTSGTSRSSGGLGGGGLGGVFDNTTNPTAGTANTGGGGGGQPYGLNPTAGGGSGIVIIRYAV